MGIPILASEKGPRFRLNQSIPEMSLEEAIAGIFVSMTRKALTGDISYVLKYWFPTRHERWNEIYLAMTGLSCIWDKGNYPIKCMSSLLC